MAVVLAGGGLPGGLAYGATNTEGMEPDENPCSPEDVSATILAIALLAVWPITFYGPGEIDAFDGGARFVFANKRVLTR